MIRLIVLSVVLLFGASVYSTVTRVPQVDLVSCRVEPGHAYKVTVIDGYIYQGQVALGRQLIRWSTKCENLRWGGVVKESWYNSTPVFQHMDNWLEKEKERDIRMRLVVKK